MASLAVSGSGPAVAQVASQTIVLKIGSSSLATADGRHLNLPIMAKLVESIVDMRRNGHRVILVTSGAVAVGCQRMRLPERPKELIVKQAMAAIGQVRLMRMYDDLFSQLDQPVAQVLLSRDNLNKHHHYSNAFNTLESLLKHGVVPIINENDTVAVEELRFGDNDTLSALVASLVEADWLFLLTDVDALYSADPRKDPSAQPIRLVERLEDLKADVGINPSQATPATAASASSASSATSALPAASGLWGTGGMATKLQAATIATTAGVRTGIVKSTEPGMVLRIIEQGGCAKVGYGTEFVPHPRPIKGKKKWIAHGLSPSGKLVLDDGATSAIRSHSSLFAAGIRSVVGQFPANSAVVLSDLAGKEIARGVVNYSSAEIDMIKGKSSAQYEEVLGYAGSDEVIGRENLAITLPVSSAAKDTGSEKKAPAAP